jgi:hypothetical protein
VEVPGGESAVALAIEGQDRVHRVDGHRRAEALPSRRSASPSSPPAWSDRASGGRFARSCPGSRRLPDTNSRTSPYGRRGLTGPPDATRFAGLPALGGMRPWWLDAQGERISWSGRTSW